MATTMEAPVEVSHQAVQSEDIQNLNQLIANEYRIVGMRGDAQHGPDGIYMNPALGEEALEIEFKSVHEFTSVEEIRELGLGATDSHHQVSFGVVEYTDETGSADSAQVAIKRFEDEKDYGRATEAAIAEFDALVTVQERGFDALTPVAIIKDGKDSYLITLFRKDIISLDNDNWAVRPGETGFNTVTENLEFIANSIGTMHAKGVFHGDAQPKNFARSDLGNQVLFDLEKGYTISETYDAHAEAFNGLYNEVDSSAAYLDLRYLWMTLNRAIGGHRENIFLGHDATPEELYDTFLEHLIRPYVETLSNEATPALLEKLSVESVISALDEYVRNDLGLPAPK